MEAAVEEQGRDEGGEEGAEVREGQVEVGFDSGYSADGVQIRSPCVGGNLVGGGTDTERGRQLLWHMPLRSGVEGVIGDTKLLLLCLHNLPRLPSWVPGG